MALKAHRAAEVRILEGPGELARAAASEFQRCAENAIREQGRFTVALAGGSTPLGVYSFLADSQNGIQLPWEKIFFFFNDERCAGPGNPESNYYHVAHALFSKIAIPATNIHRIEGELEPELAAADCESALREFFHVVPGQWPRFDLMLLGLGTDGHTASLLPGTAALTERARMVVANWIPQLHASRITFTFPMLNHAAEILFLAAGEAKASIVHDVFTRETDHYPCQAVKPVNGRLLWMIDSAAAKLLRPQTGIAGTMAS